jgi:hypothetical protein
VTRPSPPGQEELTAPRWLLYPDSYYTNIHVYPLPTLRSWSEELLKRLAADRRFGLTPDLLRPGAAEAPLRAENHEAIAHALEQFFGTSGEYTYSLDLRRSGRQHDPTLDFLLVVKHGHCERFAGGLALVLRSLGIPTRIVNGFRGAEHQGEGHYLVRQSHAHSWVEALVPARRLRGKRCWVALDPTPASPSAERTGLDWSTLWGEGLKRVQMLWRSFIVDFSPDQQYEALHGLWAFLAPGEGRTSLGDWVKNSYRGRFWTKPGFWILTSLAGLLLLGVVRRIRRRRLKAGRAPNTGSGFYGRMLAILARRCGLQPEPAQTPREVAEAARQLLRQRPGTAERTELSDLPVHVAALFYRARFGHEDLSSDELRETDGALDELDRALQRRRPLPELTG